jgi:hypothetical protein
VIQRSRWVDEKMATLEPETRRKIVGEGSRQLYRL